MTSDIAIKIAAAFRPYVEEYESDALERLEFAFPGWPWAELCCGCCPICGVALTDRQWGHGGFCSRHAPPRPPMTANTAAIVETAAREILMPGVDKVLFSSRELFGKLK